MNEQHDEVPRSSKLTDFLQRHDISAPTFTRLPIKPDLFYVGRSPRVTLEAERAWLRAMHEHAEQQRAVNVGRAQVAAAGRRVKAAA